MEAILDKSRVPIIEKVETLLNLWMRSQTIDRSVYSYLDEKINLALYNGDEGVVFNGAKRLSLSNKFSRFDSGYHKMMLSKLSQSGGVDDAVKYINGYLTAGVSIYFCKVSDAISGSSDYKINDFKLDSSVADSIKSMNLLVVNAADQSHTSDQNFNDDSIKSLVELLIEMFNLSNLLVAKAIGTGASRTYDESKGSKLYVSLIQTANDWDFYVKFSDFGITTYWGIDISTAIYYATNGTTVLDGVYKNCIVKYYLWLRNRADTIDESGVTSDTPDPLLHYSRKFTVTNLGDAATGYAAVRSYWDGNASAGVAIKAGGFTDDHWTFREDGTYYLVQLGDSGLPVTPHLSQLGNTNYDTSKYDASRSLTKSINFKSTNTLGENRDIKFYAPNIKVVDNTAAVRGDKNSSAKVKFPSIIKTGTTDQSITKQDIYSLYMNSSGSDLNYSPISQEDKYDTGGYMTLTKLEAHIVHNTDSSKTKWVDVTNRFTVDDHMKYYELRFTYHVTSINISKLLNITSEIADYLSVDEVLIKNSYCWWSAFYHGSSYYNGDADENWYKSYYLYYPSEGAPSWSRNTDPLSSSYNCIMKSLKYNELIDSDEEYQRCISDPSKLLHDADDGLIVAYKGSAAGNLGAPSDACCIVRFEYSSRIYNVSKNADGTITFDLEVLATPTNYIVPSTGTYQGYRIIYTSYETEDGNYATFDGEDHSVVDSMTYGDLFSWLFNSLEMWEDLKKALLFHIISIKLKASNTTNGLNESSYYYISMLL